MGYVSLVQNAKNQKISAKIPNKKLLKTWVESEGQDERQKHKNNRTRRKQRKK